MVLKIQELCASVKKSIGSREKLISKIESETLFTVKNVQDFRSSEHVRNINQMLKIMSMSKVRSGKMKITTQSATDIRDYLMVSLTYFNIYIAIKFNEHIITRRQHNNKTRRDR